MIHTLIHLTTGPILRGRVTGINITAQTSLLLLKKGEAQAPAITLDALLPLEVVAVSILAPVTVNFLKSGAKPNQAVFNVLPSSGKRKTGVPLCIDVRIASVTELASLEA